MEPIVLKSAEAVIVDDFRGAREAAQAMLRHSGPGPVPFGTQLAIVSKDRVQRGAVAREFANFARDRGAAATINYVDFKDLGVLVNTGLPVSDVEAYVAEKPLMEIETVIENSIPDGVDVNGGSSLVRVKLAPQPL